MAAMSPCPRDECLTSQWSQTGQVGGCRCLVLQRNRWKGCGLDARWVLCLSRGQRWVAHPRVGSAPATAASWGAPPTSGCEPSQHLPWWALHHSQSCPRFPVNKILSINILFYIYTNPENRNPLLLPSLELSSSCLTKALFSASGLAQAFHLQPLYPIWLPVARNEHPHLDQSRHHCTISNIHTHKNIHCSYQTIK